MNLRYSYDYAKPTTLTAIIADALDAVHPTAGPQSNVRREVEEIVGAAWNALIANVGVDDAVQMAIDAGIDYNDLPESVN